MRNIPWINRSAAFFYDFFWVALDWLYPPFCAGCGRSGTLWCQECQNNASPVNQHQVCVHCGQDTLNNKPICERCLDSPPAFQALRSWADFSGPLRKAIHSLKYQNNMGLGVHLAAHMIQLLDQLNWPIDVVIPVPLNVHRLAERGYNQSNLLSRPIAFSRNLPFSPRALVRIKNTASQVGLSAVERKTNVSNAFQASPNHVLNKTILLVDDVTTTGATMAACSHALLAAGARQVFAITLARVTHPFQEKGGEEVSIAVPASQNRNINL